MPEKRLPAIVDRAIWEKITKRRAGIRWANAVEKNMAGFRGPRRGNVYREVWRAQNRSKRKGRRRKKLALINKVKEEKHLEIYGGVLE